MEASSEAGVTLAGSFTDVDDGGPEVADLLLHSLFLLLLSHLLVLDLLLSEHGFFFGALFGVAALPRLLGLELSELSFFKEHLLLLFLKLGLLSFFNNSLALLLSKLRFLLLGNLVEDSISRLWLTLESIFQEVSPSDHLVLLLVPGFKCIDQFLHLLA